MIVGYSIIAVPTGIVSAEIAKYNYKTIEPKCINCGNEINSKKDNFCSKCGTEI